MKIWQVSLTVEVEAETEDEAIAEATSMDNTASASAATVIREYNDDDESAADVPHWFALCCLK